ncbi:uncharacterized protein N7459_008049 [Penicillium hispanicum]|uniref:uncharacterized protein n=1 Tax=Penicillium hispanicum TaxID=1080232 RepID=UPI0025412BE0|nr:uncharacterized protein N7459_008049 [Penicillium hispanicum]KAJ5573622.1 hypothetical protein N7459_008049 [Penicillium hispanicum]
MDEKEVVVTKSVVDDDSGWHPDIVVGIDFGMTYTGVAYSSGPEWSPPKTIQRWPGKLPGELTNKVQTCIEYAPGSSKPKSWGYLCNQEDVEANIKEFFKLHLAPQYRDNHSKGPSRREAQQWFQDYISCIYEHVVTHLNATVPLFPSRKVEFLFSVPTTWKDVRMIEETKAVIEGAINTKSPNHKAFIGLTEAEAAAVYACKQHYQVGTLLDSFCWESKSNSVFIQKDDVILICDAGGGTTDVNILRLLSRREPTQLEQLSSVEGRPIGSVFVDRHAHRLISERLDRISSHLAHSVGETAWTMISGRFQRIKCSFGTDTMLVPWLKIDVPSLGAESTFPEADIYNGQMRLSWDHIRECFDGKIDEMCNLLDTHIHQMNTDHPGEQISYLVLSGGFGSSPYVRQRLLERFGDSAPTRPPNTRNMSVLLADEPQLVVVHGLVMDRTQQLKQGVQTFGSRCCPVSYGIVCDKLYNPAKHVGQPLWLDPRDNNTYAINQVDWLVRQGKPVPSAGISKGFQIRMEQGQQNEPFKVRFVMSTLPSSELPESLNQYSVHPVCNLDIFTEGVDRKLKNRHWYNLKPAFWRANFDVNVVVGPADLKFELWSHETRIRTSGHEPIHVKWEPAGEEQE